MNVLSWILTFLTAATAVCFFVVAHKRRWNWQKISAFAIGSLGLALAGMSTLNSIEKSRALELSARPVARENPELKDSGIFVTLPLPSSFDISGFHTIKLNQAGENISGLEQTGAAGDKASIIVLDASQGIHETYKEQLTAAFGALKSVAETDKVAVCWRRTAFFPYATGRCDTRVARFTMDLSPNDLTRTDNDRSTARVKTTPRANYVLITHKMPSEQGQSREESCLLALAKGRLCASAEILPGPTTAVISIDSDEAVNRQVLEEYSLAKRKELVEALRIYEEPNPPIIEKIKSVHPDGICRGLIDNRKLVVTDLHWLSDSLSNIKNETTLSKELSKLNSYLDCPGLLSLKIPSLQFHDPRSAARSLLTHLQDFTFWFTNTTSYLNRVHKIEDVKLATDSVNSRIWIQTPGLIKSLAISVVTPLKFPEELLQNIRIQQSTSEWRLYRMGPSGFRITLDQAAPLVSIDLSDFLPTINQPKLKLKTFLRTSGISSSLQIAFLIGAILSLVHALSPHNSKREERWTLTFYPVALITFILVFLSHQTARRPAGNDAFLAMVENPTLPSHIFLRDWPSDWFSAAPPSVKEVALSQELQKRNSRWLKLLKDAQAHSVDLAANGRISRDVNALLSGTSIGTATRGSRDVVIWDSPRARNFFFRKSPIYQGAIIGWQNLVDREQHGWQLNAADSLSAAIPSSNAVVVIPDFRFVKAEELNQLDAHVAGGGILVFSERLALDDLGGAELNVETLKGEAGIGHAILAAGYGKTKVSRFSPVVSDGFEVENINVEHRVAAKPGQGSAWINGVAYKSGSVIFLGVQPTEARTQAVVTTVIRRLQGEHRSIRDPGPGCATALLIQPFGASHPAMTAFAQGVRRAGIEPLWLIDPVSFARMMPIWEKTFKTDDVAFLDDGRSETRIVGAHLIRALKGENAKPIFATLRPGPDGKIEGPDGDLILAREIVTNDLGESVRQWASECTKGTAPPRLIASTNDSAEWRRRAEVIQKTGPRQSQGIRAYIERKKTLVPENSSARRSFRFKIDDPLQMTQEKQ